MITYKGEYASVRQVPAPGGGRPWHEVIAEDGGHREPTVLREAAPCTLAEATAFADGVDAGMHYVERMFQGLAESMKRPSR